MFATSETQTELNRYEARLVETSKLIAGLKIELQALAAQVFQTSQERNIYAAKVQELERQVAKLTVANGPKLVEALHTWLTVDGSAVAQALNTFINHGTP